MLAAPKLARPLLLMHGLADDKVFPANTPRLSRALLAAGRPHETLRHNAEQAHADITELTGLFETGSLHAAAETALPLAQAVQAHRLLEDRAVLGRLLLMP